MYCLHRCRIILALLLIFPLGGVLAVSAAGHRTGELIDELAAGGVYENGRYRTRPGIPGEEKAATLALVADLTREMAVMKIQLQETREALQTLRREARERSPSLPAPADTPWNLSLETRLRFEENAWKTALSRSVNTDRLWFRSRLGIRARAAGPVDLELILEDHARLGSYKPDANADGTASRPFIYRGMLSFFLDLPEPAWIRVGRQPLRIGRGFLYDGVGDGLLLAGSYRGTRLAASVWDARDMVRQSGGAAGTNDGMNTVLLEVRRAWERATTAVFGLIQDRSEFPGFGNLKGSGGFFDLRWGGTVLAWFEGISLRDSGYSRDLRGGAVRAKENGVGLQGGVRWQASPRVGVTASLEERGKDFFVLGHEDDLSDSAYRNNSSLLAGYQSDGTAVRDSYNNSRIFSLVVGYQALKQLFFDFWYEKLESLEPRPDLFGQGTELSGNFDQSAVQSVVTFHYTPDASVKVRYRSTRFRDDDPDMAVLTPASRPVDSQQLRLDLTVRF